MDDGIRYTVENTEGTVLYESRESSVGYYFGYPYRNPPAYFKTVTAAAQALYEWAKKYASISSLDRFEIVKHEAEMKPSYNRIGPV
jgi:hypothetical protein